MKKNLYCVLDSVKALLHMKVGLAMQFVPSVNAYRSQHLRHPSFLLHYLGFARGVYNLPFRLVMLGLFANQDDFKALPQEYSCQRASYIFSRGSSSVILLCQTTCVKKPELHSKFYECPRKGTMDDSCPSLPRHVNRI